MSFPPPILAPKFLKLRWWLAGRQCSCSSEFSPTLAFFRSSSQFQLRFRWMGLNEKLRSLQLLIQFLGLNLYTTKTKADHLNSPFIQYQEEGLYFVVLTAAVFKALRWVFLPHQWLVQRPTRTFLTLRSKHYFHKFLLFIAAVLFFAFLIPMHIFSATDLQTVVDKFI